jgi:mono/diheme cytochrome c family protein
MPEHRGLRVVTSGRVGLCVLVALWLGALVPHSFFIEAAPARQLPPAAAAPASGAAAHRATFNRYCVSCHSQAMKDRGTVPVALDRVDLANVSAEAEVWEKVVLKLRAGLMPPAGAPRADKATHDAMTSWIESELDRAAAENPNPGRTEPFHRLNRTEYRNAVRDLLGLEVDVASLLPADDVSYGFDNIAGVLKMSPTLLERYLAAAQKVSRLAIGKRPPAPSIDYFRVADDLSQDRHLPGFPFGTRGGTTIAYIFPMDAEYEIRVRLARDLNESVPPYTDAQHVEVSIDGERVGTFTLPGVGQGPPAAPSGDAPAQSPDSQSTSPDGPAQPPAPSQPRAAESGNGPPQPQAAPPGAPQPAQPQRPAISQITQTVRVSARERAARNKADEAWNLRVPVAAGQRTVIVTFTNRTSALDETTRLPFLRPYPSGVNIPETRLGAHLRSVEISGPHEPTGAGDSPSRARIFTCRPTSEETACATTILSSLARRAYRRPVADADVQPLLEMYREGREAGTFEDGIERAVRRLLVSPEFLLRVERDSAGVPPNTAYRIGDVELASRLSFFLWSSIPDDELLALAERGELGQPATLAAQVRRMIADPRAEAFVTNFAGQWLFLRNLAATVPVQSIFPDFDDALRQAFRRETELFFESIVREDRSALDLLRADYTFLNERLARHYGIPNVTGSHFRRVALGPQSKRAGLLGHGSILTVTSYPDRTSPVVRGKWILENLLGTPPPPPVPDVPPLRPASAGGTVLSIRERMAQHRALPACASCHAMMDPLGFSLENFDAVGKYRTLGETGAPIDASGVLPDGTPFNGPDGLRAALLQSNRFVSTLTEKMLTYALGRGMEYSDAPAVRAIVREAEKDEYRLSSLIMGVVQSTPFRMRRTAE